MSSSRPGGPSGPSSPSGRGGLSGLSADRWSDLSRPPLSAASLRSALLAPAGPLGRLDVVARTGSTNSDLAAAWRREGAGRWPHPSALLADVQTAGRGRAGRTWTSPPRSGVHLSLLLRPEVAAAAPVPLERWGWLPLLAGLATASVLRDVAGLPASVKWPNDVLVGERKVSGVLAEVVRAEVGGPSGPGGPSGSGEAAVVLGVGVNTGLRAEELPVPTATSLALEGAATTDREVVVRALVRALAAEVDRWAAAGGDAVACGLAARVREACSTLGRPVRVDLPAGEPLRGVAEGIDDDGRLLVRRAPGGPGGGGGSAGAGGEVMAVAAGDVVHVRPGDAS